MPAKKSKAKKGKKQDNSLEAGRRQSVRIAHIMQLLQEAPQRDERGNLRYHSYDTIAEYLFEPHEGPELPRVSKRALQDDMKAIREMPGVNLIEPKKGRKGFQLILDEGKDGHLPMLDLAADDLFSFMVMDPILKQYEGTNVGAQLEHSFGKLKRALVEKLKVAPEDLTAVSVKDTKVPHINMEHLRKLLKATQKKCCIKARYYRPTKPEKDYVLWPYNVANVNGTWYLYALDESQIDLKKKTTGKMQAFKAVRFTSVEVLEAKIGKLAGKFDINEHVDWGIIRSGKEPVPVEIRFAPYLNDYLHEKTWHHTQKISSYKDGYIRFELELYPDMREFSAWLKTWGGTFEVVKPESLRQEMIKTGLQMARNHGHEIHDEDADDATTKDGGYHYLDDNEDDDD